MSACAGACECRAAAVPASAIAALRMARSITLPPSSLFTNGAFLQPPVQVKIARWPLQLGAARIAATNGGFFPVADPVQKRRRAPGVRVVNKVQGLKWLNGQGPSFWQLQLGFIGVRSSTPYNSSQNGVGVASVSEVWSKMGGGGGKGFGGWGGHGGGDGFGGPAAGEGSSLGASAGDTSKSVAEDVIFLIVGGMSCGGCSASVKRILEAQPQVKEATVDLATETATVQITAEPVAASGWEVAKRELGESLAKHLTSCGFKSSLKEDGDKVAPAV